MRTDRILGATIVARHAGEMINELTLAMVAVIGLRALARVIHAYPTQAEAIKKAADAYNRTRLTPTIQSLLRRWVNWWPPTRRGYDTQHDRFGEHGANMTERLARAESDCAEQGGGHCAAGSHLLDQGPLGEEDSAH